MSDEFLTRLDDDSRHLTGDHRPLERVVSDFSLYGATKRVEALRQLDDHMRSLDVAAGENSLRDYARLTRLRREVDRTHQNLLKVGR